MDEFNPKMDSWNPTIKPIPGKMYYTTAEGIEEYMKSLKIEEEVGNGFYGGSEEYLERPYNTVTKPKHYMLFEKEGIEVRDVIEKLILKVKEAPLMPNYRENALFESDYVQMMQYLMRFMDKNGKEDLEKARWYLDKLIEAY